jgi:hypothetical protein
MVAAMFLTIALPTVTGAIILAIARGIITTAGDFRPPGTWPGSESTRRARSGLRSGDVAEDTVPDFASGTLIRAYLNPKGERR